MGSTWGRFGGSERRSGGVRERSGEAASGRFFFLLGFKIIKLSISDEFQEIRLKNTYPDNYQVHIERKNDISESYTDNIPFDYIYNVTTNSIEDLHRFLDNIIKINLNIKD